MSDVTLYQDGYGFDLDGHRVLALPIDMRSMVIVFGGGGDGGYTGTGTPIMFNRTPVGGEVAVHHDEDGWVAARWYSRYGGRDRLRRADWDGDHLRQMDWRPSVSLWAKVREFSARAAEFAAIQESYGDVLRFKARRSAAEWIDLTDSKIERMVAERDKLTTQIDRELEARERFRKIVEGIVDPLVEPLVVPES